MNGLGLAMEETLKHANSLFRAGDYCAALRAYEGAIRRAPQLASTIQFNIEQTRKRLGKQTQGEETPETQMKVSDLYTEVEAYVSALGVGGLQTEGPLVSVIVTTHNVEDYIEQCLQSLYFQSYTNIELVVVDDCSSDGTARVVQRLSKSLKPIRFLRLACNLGTYFAKNWGIEASKGEILFFQDGDDVSHPHRIALQMTRLLSSQSACVRGAYARFEEGSERVIRVNGLVSKLGLITLGVKREVFQRIGLFNCTTKASDDEFFERFIKFCGRKALVDEKLPLYYATMRDGSLFSDMVATNADGSITQKPSSERSTYVSAFRSVHDSVAADQVGERFSFPRIRDAIRVPPSLSKLCNSEVPVIVNVCSIPERRNLFAKTIRSIASQCDRINVYLDRYDEVPDFIERLGSKAVVFRSQTKPGLRDNGKFIVLESLVAAKEAAYYFTIDDDIIYPPDYVNCLIRRLREYDDRVVAGVHGVLLKDHPRGYFSDARIVHGFEKELERERLVNVLGTGTVAFHTSILSDFRLESFEHAGMVDLYFAALCKRLGVPMVCIKRPEAWLKEMNDADATSLFSEFAGSDEMQGQLIRSTGAWGYQGIKDVMSHPGVESIHERLTECLPRLRLISRAVRAGATK